MGAQVRKFAESIAARMTGGELPEDGYEGDYVEELARELATAGADPADLDALERLGTERMREQIAATLERFGVGFDTWYSERSLYESGRMTAAIEELRRRGHVVRQRGSGVAADERVRRRQGPGADPLRRLADLLRARRRLSPGEVRARLRSR